MADIVLVTGGAGLIGSHLCERLLSMGRRVICLDDFSSGSSRNIRHLKPKARFAVLHHDVTQPLDLEVGQIFNLACPASPRQYQRDPVSTVLTSVIGTKNMLDLARRTGSRLLQASTSEVYGDPAVHPQDENYRGNVSTIGPRACYDEGKRCAETLCADYRHRHGVTAGIARIFNTYGPRMHPDDGRVVSNFILQALTGAPLTIFGDGRQTRSFCHVDDTVDALLAFMAAGPATLGPINLGNPEEISMIDLAERILALTGSRSRLEFHPLPGDDPCRRRPDITRARTELGWRPRIALDEGLTRTIAYFEDLLSETGTVAATPVPGPGAFPAGIVHVDAEL
ncbi:UDP-glucuronic acid decarboxylase family protein [Zavarzinia compransoris]|uniref:NAD-dependent dehydratase n=1 Tax=Zavarzinia compransoris TaxID=1264899 RepID=A0A317E6Y1_9PROT|nr:UDP-glucuronic acid decarboxylase family protein [Zavarzinia compransoris]PWR21986.1 NAD-dependent dehydratase [Zavarzinia compransoris]TDP47276.1 UDP-glucuronate decarboxylase [Zavarzinia compransoris]